MKLNAESKDYPSFDYYSLRVAESMNKPSKLLTKYSSSRLPDDDIAMHELDYSSKENPCPH